MENVSNLSILINILINGMIMVFFVLLLVFLLGKFLVKLINLFDFSINKEDNIKENIFNKIKDISGGKGRVLKITKLD